jgi:methyl-accepting chemotaxis protein
MRKLSINTKLIFLSIFFLGALGILGMYTLFGLEKVVGRLQNLAGVQIPAVRTMSLIDMMHDGLRAVAFRSLYESDSKDESTKKEVADELKEMSEKMREYIVEIKRLDIRPESLAAVEEALPEVEAYIESANEIVTLALSGKKELAVLRVPDFQKVFSRLEDKLGSLGDLIEEDSELSRELGSSTAATTKNASIILIFLSIIAGVIGSVWTIGGLMKTLSATVDSLLKNSEQVRQTSKAIAGSSDALSQASTEQASSLEETATSLEEISAMIAKASESAEMTATSSNESQLKAEEGQVAADQMIQSIGEISTSNEAIMAQVYDSNKRLAEIVNVIKEIGNKTTVINEIVFQTKLLSFNASVEAARAGEHGKGFAVVAQEVGNLAQMSGQAAKEISDMLTASISKVETIVSETKSHVEDLVAQGKSKVEKGNHVALMCSELLKEIVQNARKVSGLAREISSASREQAQGVSEINIAVGQLNLVTQQNSSTSESNAKTAEVLSSQSSDLQKVVLDLLMEVRGAGSSSKRKLESDSGTGSDGNISRRQTKVVSISDRSSKQRKSKAPEENKEASFEMVSGEGRTPAWNDQEFKD